MDLSTIVSAAATILAVPAFIFLATSTHQEGRWRTAALLSLAFAGWTVYTIIEGGPFGFIPEHIGNVWETQIWIDLLILGGTAWYLLQPRLRAAGIRPLPWLPVILATGSVGMLCLIAWLLRTEAAVATSNDVAVPVH